MSLRWQKLTGLEKGWPETWATEPRVTDPFSSTRYEIWLKGDVYRVMSMPDIPGALDYANSVGEFNSIQAAKDRAEEFMKYASGGRRNPDEDNGAYVDADEFDGGAARAIWSDVYINLAEEAEQEHDVQLGPGAGGDWLDVIPEMPPSALRAGVAFREAVEQDTGRSIDEIMVGAASYLGSHVEDFDSDEYGWYTAMQALGHGVDWQSHVYQQLTPAGKSARKLPSDLKYPHIDASSYDGVYNSAYDAVQAAVAEESD